MNDSSGQGSDLTQPAELQAFGVFFAKHKEEFLRIAVRRLRNLHDADEALMDAGIQMCRKWPRIEAHPNPLALAHTILRTAITDFYRKRARHTSREVSIPGTSYTAYADTPTVDDILTLRGYDRLDRALDRLRARAPQQAECVRLRYLEDQTLDEIADQLSITKEAAKANIQKGRKNLQALMDLPEPGKGDS
ncbi:sigma-70 family RNA polymerase sigma factor [Streptomyces flavidovirens]|uniref:RNA polymerase sigma factor n=1 Tax=Streptomyces flavidovirens TaxID=67298 RepID=UPI00341CCF4D